MIKNPQYYFFLIIIYMFTFEFALMQVVPVFKYWDEMYAALFVALLLWRRPWKKGAHNIDLKLLFLCIALIMVGVTSNIIFQYQNISAVIKDVLLCMKFFMGIYTTTLLFQDFDFEYYKTDIRKHVKVIVCILFLLLLVDIVFKVFPCNEIRYGLRSEQLFFGHPTGLASVSFYLIVMLMLTYSGKFSDYVCLFMASILVASTLRAKAIAVVAIFVYLFISVVVFRKKIHIKNLIMLVPPVIIIGWEQIYGYFFGELSLESARGALFYKSFEIMKDHFPLGTGFGTYASAPSGENYSIIYPMYDLDHIWGLTADWPAFVSDSFWPMIFGQFGVLGTIIYVVLIIMIWNKVSKVFYLNKTYYVAGVGAILYLLVSSTSESAFVNPLALPLSVVIGMVYIAYNNRVD